MVTIPASLNNLRELNHTLHRILTNIGHLFWFWCLLFFSCSGPTNTGNCVETQQSFITAFNSRQFHQIPHLFDENSGKGGQLKKLTEDLKFMREVAGKIHSLDIISTEGNKIHFRGNLEATALDISFIYNTRCQLTSLLIKNHFPKELPILERNATPMILPFHGEWYVFWGGPTVEQNYHNHHQNMRGAFDFVIRDAKGKSYRTDGKTNEDYYAFGKEIIAPCDAEVVKVIRGVKDNEWPERNKFKAHGNAVILKTPGEEYLFFAHLKENSIVVNEGERVTQGQKLGQCGNSGYSSEPHLHFNLQNISDLFDPTGAPCFFDNILVDGKLMHDYSPVRGERIKNQHRK